MPVSAARSSYERRGVLLPASEIDPPARAAAASAAAQARIETHQLDVTKVEQIETIPRIVNDLLGRIDILVNNAGTGTY